MCHRGCTHLGREKGILLIKQSRFLYGNGHLFVDMMRNEPPAMPQTTKSFLGVDAPRRLTGESGPKMILLYKNHLFTEQESNPAGDACRNKAAMS